MPRGYWTSWPDTVELDGERLTFDTHGTPMDQDWCLSTEEFCDPERGRVGRDFVERALGLDVLREVLERIGGPPPEAFPRPPPAPPAPKRRRSKKVATAPPPREPPAPPPAPIPAEVNGPTHLGIALMSDILIQVPLPIPPMKVQADSRSTPMDGAELTTAVWSMSGEKDGVEAGVSAETSWWNPLTPAQSSIRVRVLDRRGELRAIFVSADAPFEVWSVRTMGEPLVPQAWLAAWLGRSDLRLDTP